MMVRWLAIAVVLAGSAVSAQTTQPAPTTNPSSDPAALEIRAAQAFDAGDHAAALPLLEKLAAAYRDQPQRLGRIQEQIRVSRRQAEAVKLPPALQPPAPPPTAEARKPHVRPADGQVLTIGIRDLGNFEYDQYDGGNVPADVTALNGATVRLGGYMVPTDSADRIRSFALVPSLFNCCFGQPAQIQHTLMVKAPAGKAVSYYPDELVVEGKLIVEEKKDDGIVIGLFELEATSVKPAAK